MKLKVTSHDISGLVSNLKYLVDYRLNNIYDVDGKTYVFKLVSNNKEKKYLLMESSSRFHLVNNFKAERVIPTSFIAKLRKHIKNKRLEKMEQLNWDRVIDFQFGNGDHEYHIILELYASGNLILTDNKYYILATLHQHFYSDKIKVRPGNIYPFEHAITNITKYEYCINNIYNWILNEIPKLKKKIKYKELFSYSSSPIGSYNVILIEEGLLNIGINPNKKIEVDYKLKFNLEKIEKMMDKIIELQRLDNFNGYIILDKNGNKKLFLPYLYKSILLKEELNENSNRIIKYELFEEAVTNFFETIKNEKILKVINEEEKKIITKQDRTLKNIKDKCIKLEKEQEKIQIITNWLQNNINTLEEINIYLRNCNDKKYFEKTSIIKEILDNKNIEITNIEFHKNTYSVKFEEYNVLINFTISIWQNIKNNYQTKKKANIKQKKTQEAHDIVKKKLEKKENIKKNNIKKWNNENRKKNWFEQFFWFFSNDGFLIIVGKNAQQNELIVKKYLEKNDIYLHSDIHGSGSCIIKNPDKKEIPPQTYEQAGCFVISKTKAWKSGVPDNPYWVYPDQVSKTAESGEYLSTGSFMIRGKKNYLTKPKLELGLTILYKLKDKSEFSYFSKEEDIDYVLITCCPYQTLLKINTKVKIIPGTQKVKKAIDQVKNILNKKCTELEKSILMSLNQEINDIVPSKCFILK